MAHTWRPSTRPWPVTTPSAGVSAGSETAWPRSDCWWARSPNSTKVPGSNRRSRRSRTVSFPRSCWRAIRSGPPMPRLRCRRALRSSVRAAKSSDNLDRILGTQVFRSAEKPLVTSESGLADITSPKSLASFRPTRFQVTIAAALVIVVALAGVAILVLNSPIAGVHARLDVQNADHVRVQQPVTVRFDQSVDLSRTRVTLDPIAGFKVTKKSDRLILTPIGSWATEKRYTVLLTDVPNTHHSFTLSGWRTVFTTQPRVGIAGILVDGKAVADPTQAAMKLNSKLAIAFTTAMKTSTVTINVNGQPLTADKVQWDSSNDSATLSIAHCPYT